MGDDIKIKITQDDVSNIAAQQDRGSPSIPKKKSGNRLALTICVLVFSLVISGSVFWWKKDRETKQEIKRLFALAKTAMALPDVGALEQILTRLDTLGGAGHELTNLQYDLATVYTTRHSLPNSAERGLYWCEKSARGGNANAQWSLGSILMEAPGADSTREAQAVQWFQRAAEQGLPEAQYNLAFLLERGRGVEKNEEEAAKWYQAAAQSGDSEAMYALSFMHRMGRGGMLKDPAQSIDLLKLAASNGHVLALLTLGNDYETGTEVPRDEKTAVEYFKLAANQGNAEAQFNLGRFYAEGKGVIRNGDEAMKWWKLAADQDYPAAQESLVNYERVRNGNVLSVPDNLLKLLRHGGESSLILVPSNR